MRAPLQKCLETKLLERGSFVIGLILFKLSLDLCYVWIVAPHWTYLGLSLEIAAYKVYESYALLLLFGLFLPSRVRNPSHFFVVLFFLMVAVPLLSLYGLRNESRTYTYMVLGAFGVLMLALQHPAVRVRPLKQGPSIILGLSWIVLLGLFIWIIGNSGWRYINFDLTQVYEFREEVDRVVFPSVMDYLRTWYAKVFNIVLFAFALWRRKWTMALIVIGFQIMYFSVVAQKAVLFYPLLVLFAYVALRWRYALQFMIIGLTGVAIISAVMFWAFDMLLPVSLFVRRVFFTTVSNHFAYYHFFQESGFLYLSNSVFQGWLHYPFDMNVPSVISAYLFGEAISRTNTGILATGYMHFGWLGMLLFTVIVGFILRLVDGIVRNGLPLWVGVSVVMVPLWNLRSADLTTTLFTHGLGLAVLCLWLLSALGNRSGIPK